LFVAVVSTGVDEVVQIEEAFLTALEAEVVVTCQCADAVVAISNSGVATVVVAMGVSVVVKTVNSAVITVVSVTSGVVSEAATKSTTILTTTTSKDLTGWTMTVPELSTIEQAIGPHTVRSEAINMMSVTRG
jgi:D-arabinose 5-phosphate isomerase GutQ